ncbi:MAG: Uncharacterized protein AWU57_358 [Marinobacter sp. T13-3]|nr:MAG: Uncharacterized protein AWU57_358 [Marinobacter sp. T13-3]
MKKVMIDENPGTSLRTSLRKFGPDLVDYASAVDVLQKAATGEVVHLYQGLCPDSIEGHDARDPDCEVCRALMTLGCSRAGCEPKTMNEKHTSEIQFEHDFFSALEALNEGKFIQGTEFQSGLYIALDDDGMAAKFDVKDSNRRVGNLFIYRGLYRQRYRVFTVANEALTD